MEKVHATGSSTEAINAGLVFGTAALHGLKQLIRELEPVIGADAAERVRAKIEENIRASEAPEPIQAAILHGLR